MLQGARAERPFEAFGQRLRIDLMIAVEWAEAHVRPAALEELHHILGGGVRQDVIAASMSDEYLLLMVDALRGGGANVRFRPFEGDHQIDPQSLTEALEWAFGPRGLQQ